MRLVLFCIFPSVDKSHEKSKTDFVLACLSILSDFPTLSVALSPQCIGSYWRYKSSKYCI